MPALRLHPRSWAARGFLAIVTATVLLGGCVMQAGSREIDVEGRVTGSFGRPAEGLSVAVLGRPSVTTDADGRFSLVGVEVPYDLLVFDAAASQAQVILGLASERPDVATYFRQAPPEHTATLTFRFLDELSVGEGVIACVEAESAVGCGFQQENRSGELEVRWSGSDTLTGVLRGVSYESEGLNVSSVVATGEAPFAVVADGAATVDIPQLGAVSSAAIDVSITAPVGATVNGFGAWLAAQDGDHAQPVPARLDAVGVTPFVVPNLDGRSVGFVASGWFGGEEGLAAWRFGFDASTTELIVALPQRPRLLAPTDGEAQVDPTAPFRVAVGPDAVVIARLRPSNGADGPTLYVVTTESQFTLPDLSGYDARLTVPPGAAYEWRIETVASVATTELAADGGAVARLNEVALIEAGVGSRVSRTPAADGAYTRSGTATFDFR